jgi:putative DNA methylase
LHAATEAFLDQMPRVFDPFAGGGAIPLEAARLGCRAFGNDINPVAHIIQRASLEFPQRFGKPITYSYAAFVARYGEEEYAKQHTKQHVLDTSADSIRLANRLAFDVEFFARRLLARAEAEIGHFYPADEKGRKPIAYYWARVGTCANPSCRAEVPLLKQFYLVNKPGKQVYLEPVISGIEIHFRIRNGECASEGWVSRGNFRCPCCNNPTDVTTLKAQFIGGRTKERLLAVITDGTNGKEYRLPTPQEISVAASVPIDVARPTEQMPVKYTQALPCCTWGIASWGDLFASRQILMLNTLTVEFAKLKQELRQEPEEYGRALIAYLAILIDRLSIISTSFGIWHTGRETVERPMGRQAIPMVFDYPESNPFCDSTGSAANQIEWITRYIESEGVQPFAAICHNASSGDISQFAPKYLTAVVTDPPYYDAIAYADISDFFYVWLKRTLSDTFPLNFAFPQTPKTEECTALKHHHAGNNQKAVTHFEQKLQQIFSAIERQTRDVVSIMFAHQSTEAWTTLCNSILGASMNITGSWANDTEMMGALKTDKAFLSSSVTVACRPVVRQGEGNYKQVRDDIEATVAREVDELYRLGFRGADLLTACFGQAVSVFGQYERVEKSDGTLVTVAELLALARESAFKALLKGFDGDEYTKFYIGWLQLYGLTEADFDDAAKFSRAGLQLNVAELLSHGIFAKKGNKLTLATSAERLLAHKSLGASESDLLLDQAHRALGLYHRAQRRPLVLHLARVAPAPERPFWRVLTALGEVLPAGSDDHRLTAGLLADRDSLLREVKQLDQTPAGATGDLFA